MLLEKPDPVVINVGTGVPTSVNRLFQIASSAIGYKERPRYESLRDGEVRHIYLDSSRAKKEFEWVAETSLDQGLIQTINSMRQLI